MIAPSLEGERGSGQGQGVGALRRWAGAFAFAVWLLPLLVCWWLLGSLSVAYESLGRGLWLLVLAVCGLWSSLLWPLIWWLAPVRRRHLGRLCAAGILSSVGLFWLAMAFDRPVQLSAPLGPGARRQLERVVADLPDGGGHQPLQSTGVASCSKAVGESKLSLFVAYRARSGGSAVDCLQHDSLEAGLEALELRLSERAQRGPVKVDIAARALDLSRATGAALALLLRPGRDGVCLGTDCVMPWQLLSRGVFSTYRPVHFIPDFQFGVSADMLSAALGKKSLGEGLVSVATHSYVVQPLSEHTAELVELSRMRRAKVVVNARNVVRAERLAQAHLMTAQGSDGKFRYTLQPITGEQETRRFSLPRQAGATLVLCELGVPSLFTEETVQRAVDFFGAFERRAGGYSALISHKGSDHARLGETALPAISLLACRGRAQVNVELMSRLLHLLLLVQREDGSFAAGWDFAAEQPLSGATPLYAEGQAIMALLMAEAQQTMEHDARLPPVEQLTRATEAAMSYVAKRYWSHPLRDYFYLEENWHCLAAREALRFHRHSGYERFCAEYVRFKARLILSQGDGVDPEFDGGFGLGNLVPPHNTGAAGFGEALAAALEIHKQGGPGDASWEPLLLRVMAFLLRQQWVPATCFACSSFLPVGSMSEHTHSLVSRIDFTQHAWAALGHGGRVLDLFEEESSLASEWENEQSRLHWSGPEEGASHVDGSL